MGLFSLIGLIVLILRMPIVLEERKKTFKQIDSKPSSNLWKSPLAWVVTLYMGLQSLIPYVLLAWLPAILVEKGFMEGEAGWLMAIYQGGFLPAAFIAPIFANKYASQRGIGLVSGLMLFAGLLGTELLDGLSVIPFLILIGIGAGTTFAVAMTFFVERTHSVAQASQLSGMSQSAGYIIAACGPVTLGMLYERLGNWDISLIILMVVTLIISVLGFIGGKDRKVLE
jgi:CP family cyanate transporter-like MFS transporter